MVLCFSHALAGLAMSMRTFSDTTDGEMTPHVKHFAAISSVLTDQGPFFHSDWPTIPQIYLKGEFIGGCDVLLTMYQNKELTSLLREKGIEQVAPETTPTNDK